MNMSGTKVKRLLNTILIPLPKEAWRSAGNCDCSHCQGKEGFWDTLAVSTKADIRGADWTWTVHAPELQPKS